MRGLKKVFSLRLGGSRERGAIGVTIGVLISASVLLGMGALVVDVGQLYQERAELQNGADAGVLAVAMGCALGATSCLPATADGYVNANAKDGVAGVDLVCGFTEDGALPTCPASDGAMTSCPDAPPAGTEYAEVHTSTLTDGGSTLLPPAFARTLLGNESYDGTNVNACARASWGPPASAVSFAMTISYCEWLQATGDGSSYAAPPPYPPNPLPSPADDRVLKLHTTTDTVCPSGPAGSDGPGMFGWVDDPDGNCSVNINGGTYYDDPGVSAGNACKIALQTARNNRTTIFVPVYSGSTGQGSNGVYTLEGFAAFVVTGYRLPGWTASDWLNPANNCGGPDKCINGYFTQGLVPAAGTIGGPNLGVSIVQLTG